MMADAALVKELAEVAKDTALLHGVQMRTQESPNSSEVTAVSASLCLRVLAAVTRPRLS